MKTGAEQEWLTLREVQQFLQIGHTKAYELITTQGGIPSVRIGRAIRVNKNELARWLRQQEYSAVQK
jgi:excisionase family DNA binding protein